MAKPIGARCNLKCRYCYYKSVQNDLADTMTDELLETFIRDYIEAQTMPQVLFTWHGGEPMLLGLDFFRNVLRLEQKYAKGRNIDNAIQTNGTLINDEWAQFFHDNGFLVGISIDGPERFHNANRGNSHSMVMYGIEMLKKYDVMWNAMCVINEKNVLYPNEIYDFFKSNEAHYIQFTPLFLHSSSYLLRENLTSFSRQWGDFLCTVFDEWEKEDVGAYFINIFEATLANWIGETPGTCQFSPRCGQVGVIEKNGDVYSCDHFVDDPHKLGNIREKTFLEMMFGEQQKEFGNAKSKSLPMKCQQCKYLFACNGECPKNRIFSIQGEDSGMNYLCEGYYRYFEHVAPFMSSKADLLGFGKSDLPL